MECWKLRPVCQFWQLGQLGISLTQLDGVLEGQTSVSVLGGYRAGWLAKDGYGPVGSCGQAMGMGNPSGLALDMSRIGLTVPGRQVPAIGKRVQSVPMIKSMDRNETEGMQWLEK